MPHRLALSAAVLALAGSLGVAQAETMMNSPSGRSMAALVAFDNALASFRYL
jgi:hypothetical protein